MQTRSFAFEARSGLDLGLSPTSLYDLWEPTDHLWACLLTGYWREVTWLWTEPFCALCYYQHFTRESILDVNSMKNSGRNKWARKADRGRCPEEPQGWTGSIPCGPHMSTWLLSRRQMSSCSSVVQLPNTFHIFTSMWFNLQSKHDWSQTKWARVGIIIPSGESDHEEFTHKEGQTGPSTSTLVPNPTQPMTSIVLLILLNWITTATRTKLFSGLL